MHYLNLFQGPPQGGQGVKFGVSEMCDRIKEEFNFLQAQYHKWNYTHVNLEIFFCIIDLSRFVA